MINVTFKEIDLSKTKRGGGTGLKLNQYYLILHDGHFYIGKFYGKQDDLSFNLGWYSVPYEPPGENASGFQKIWKVIGLEKIAKENELEFAKIHKDYYIKHGCTTNGVKIDETFPIEMFLYHYNPKQKEAEKRYFQEHNYDTPEDDWYEDDDDVC